MPDARKPGYAATACAENLWTIFTNASGLSQLPTQIKRLLAAEVQRAIDESSNTFQPLPEPAGDPRQAPLLNCLTEIVSVLCYQPSIPQGHKNDMGQALCELKAACGIKLPEEKRILE